MPFFLNLFFFCFNSQEKYFASKNIAKNLLKPQIKALLLQICFFQIEKQKEKTDLFLNFCFLYISQILRNANLGAVPCACPYNLRFYNLGAVPCACPYNLRFYNLGAVPCACPLNLLIPFSLCI